VVHITPKTLTVLGQVAADKEFDGTTDATLSDGVLSGVIANETVALEQDGAFASAAVGEDIAIIATNSIGGAAAVNYSLQQPIGLKASINAVPVVAPISPPEVAPPVIPPVDVAPTSPPVTPPVDIVPTSPPEIPPVEVAPTTRPVEIAETPSYVGALGGLVTTNVPAFSAQGAQFSLSTSPVQVDVPSPMKFDISGLNLTVVEPDDDSTSKD